MESGLRCVDDWSPESGLECHGMTWKSMTLESMLSPELWVTIWCLLEIYENVCYTPDRDYFAALKALDDTHVVVMDQAAVAKGLQFRHIGSLELYAARPCGGHLKPTAHLVPSSVNTG